MKSTEFIYGHFYSFGGYSHCYFCIGKQCLLIYPSGDIGMERHVGDNCEWYEVWPDYPLTKLEQWKAENL